MCETQKAPNNFPFYVSCLSSNNIFVKSLPGGLIIYNISILNAWKIYTAQ